MNISRGHQHRNGFTLTLTGTNFNASSVVNWNGSPRATTFVSSTSLQAAILTSDLTTNGTFVLTVTNPSPGGGTSGSKNLIVASTPPQQLSRPGLDMSYSWKQI